MIRMIWQFSLIFTACSACVFGANKNSFNKRSQTVWYQERLAHRARDLTDLELKFVAGLSDEKQFNDTLTNILIPRVVDTPGHAKVRNYIIKQMESLGWTVETHSFDDNTPLGRKTFTNVLATLNPSATRRLVIACHYDSKLTPTGFLGATDSAVPCSMMINLAHTLKNQLNKYKSERPDLTLQLMFIDGEEALVNWNNKDSLYGARKLARKLQSAPFPPGHQTNELHRIDLFLLLDLLGTEDCAIHNYFIDTQPWYQRLSDFELRLLSANLMKRKSVLLTGRAFYTMGIQDDHVPFLERGVPIMHFIPIPFPKVWHKISDNLSSLHFPSIQNMNTLLRVFVVDYLHLSL